MKHIALLLLLLVVIKATDIAPLLYSDSPYAIHGSYIIVLKDSLNQSDRDYHIQTLRENITLLGANAEIGFVYDVILGFSARLTDELLKVELVHPDVKYVEVNQVFSSSIQQNYSHNLDVITQTGATWGITRISKVDLNLNGVYVYNAAAGEGVDVYVLDTGILITHKDFGGRASYFFNAITGESNSDLSGHGTHCAGTIGGTTYGVAKKVSLKSVKVLNSAGKGTTDGILAGVNAVPTTRDRPSIASMSLDGPATATLDTAIQNSIASGTAYVVAAGNLNVNACNYSPGRVPEAITVGATTMYDYRASYSNYGRCVDLFAPGSSITSDYIGSTNTATKVLTGTSMAAPHVAGALAIHLGLYPTLTPAESQQWIIDQSTKGKLPNPGTASNNYLLYSPAADN